jgi:hypothetical protein
VPVSTLFTGTSKPIYYRTLLNENAVWRVSSDTTPLTRDTLQKLTYHMSFQYTTATKSVRTVPVVYYSQRLANLVMGYINLIRYTRGDDTLLTAVKMMDNDPSMEDVKIPKKRDGNELEIEKYIRTDVSIG